MNKKINEKKLHNILKKSLRKALNESNIYTEQWDAEKEMFFNGLTTGRAFFDNNIVYVEYPGDVNDNDPRYISYELGDNRLRDDHFSMQHSPTLSDKEIREIYLTLQDMYGYNGPMPENEYYESFRRKVNNIIKESLRRKLNEGTTDEEAYNKWEWLKDNVGAEIMVDNLIDWLDSNTIDKIIGWFEEEGYLEGYYDDGMFESKKSKHTINEVGGVMEEWYQEEDYDGNVGESGMVRSYEPGTLYIHNFEQMAKEEGYKNWKDMFMYWWSEVKYDTPWYWVPEQNCKGGRFLFNAEGDDVEELYEQIVITGRHP